MSARFATNQYAEQTMSIESWLALTAAFVLGAISPGPSLAIVLRNTVAGGRHQGVMTGLGHGIGFGLYAFAAAAGLATALNAHPLTAPVLRWGGVVLLVYLAIKFFAAGRKAPDASRSSGKSSDEHHQQSGPAFWQGFAVAVFNPKILAWMLAIYAPIIDAGASLPTLIAMGLLGMIIDGAWYMTAAGVLGRGPALTRLRANAHHIDTGMGVLMALLALFLVFGTL
jgi:threonine/homoserine/homoserine lactone efflux protein